MRLARNVSLAIFWFWKKRTIGGSDMDEEPRQESGEDGGGPLVLEVSLEPQEGGKGKQGDYDAYVQFEGPDAEVGQQPDSYEHPADARDHQGCDFLPLDMTFGLEEYHCVEGKRGDEWDHSLGG